MRGRLFFNKKFTVFVSTLAFSFVKGYDIFRVILKLCGTDRHFLGGRKHMRNQVFKKLFSVLLALIMVAGLLPASVLAEGEGNADSTPAPTEAV